MVPSAKPRHLSSRNATTNRNSYQLLKDPWTKGFTYTRPQLIFAVTSRDRCPYFTGEIEALTGYVAGHTEEVITGQTGAQISCSE